MAKIKLCSDIQLLRALRRKYYAYPAKHMFKSNRKTNLDWTGPHWPDFCQLERLHWCWWWRCWWLEWINVGGKNFGHQHLKLVINISFPQYGYIDGDDKRMLVTFCWWHSVGENFRVDFMLVTSFGCWCPMLMIKENVGNKNGQKRHQHLKVVSNRFRLPHPSPTPM